MTPRLASPRHCLGIIMRMVAALQVNEAGVPVLDLAHVIECLNKLEVGSAEKVLLVRTNQTQTTQPPSNP